MKSASSSSPFDFSTVLVNVYTWVAVISAAFSRWRIRSAACNSLPPPETAAWDEIEDHQPPTRLSESENSAISSTSRRKVKEYYYEYDVDCNEDDDCIGELTESSSWRRRMDGYPLPMEWEKLLKTKMGEELSWYHFQDLTVFDGNIVKFWTSGELHR